MDKKIRLIFVGLIALSVISILYSFSLLGSKEALKKEYHSVREMLKKENETLAKRANAAIEDKRSAENRLEEVKRQMDQVIAEKDELQKQFDVLNKEKDELAEKLKLKATAPGTPQVQMVSTVPTKGLETEDAYWAQILKEKARLEVFVQRLKERLDNFLITVEELKKDKLALELEIKNVSRDKSNLERKFEYNEKLIDGLTTELVREKKEKRRIENELESFRKEQTVFINQIKALNEQKVTLEKHFKEAQAEKTKLEDKLVELNTTIDKRILEIEQMKRQLEVVSEDMSKPGEPAAAAKQAVQLPPIVVHSPEDKEEAAVEYRGLPGKVLAINAEHNFVVIDLGESQGISQGQLFNIYRNKKKIAIVEVIQVRDNISACDIKQQLQKIEVGDGVK